MASKKKILITGGTGLIGQALTPLLIEKGYAVSYLSRQKKAIKEVDVIQWNPEAKQIDQDALDGFEAVIHLAGAGIADKKWTEKRKKLIISSRTDTAQLLFDCLKATTNKPKALISSSGIGFYGARTTDHIFEESDASANDFLGYCCQQWEAAALPFQHLGMRVAIIRTGVVLSDKGGALSKMTPPVKRFFGAPLGSGLQYVPWIHLSDICNIYLYCLENQLSGIYNGVAPSAINNKQLTEALAVKLNKPLWLPNVPEFALKLFLGEMADMVLKGSQVSSKKILEKGFQFQYERLEEALSSLKI